MEEKLFNKLLLTIAGVGCGILAILSIHINLWQALILDVMSIVIIGIARKWGMN